MRTNTLKAGWLVLFDWKKNGRPQHVGLLESVAGQTLNTIEFNTSDMDNSNGGTVARRERDLESVLGVIRERTDIGPLT